MHIRYEKETRGMEFDELSVGELFAELDDDSAVYIKINDIETKEDDDFNAILLSNGQACCFYPDNRVRPLEGELVLSDP